MGTPAVFGDTVLCLAVRGGTLFAVHRRDGKVISAGRIAPDRGHGGGGGHSEIVVGSDRILVRTPLALGGGNHAFLPYSMAGREVHLRAADGLMDFGVTPAACRGGLIACERKEEWQLWQGDRGRVLASRRYTPALFRSPVAPTVLGDVAYFGTWAADVETGEVLWRLPLESVRFGAVPADRLVLVVDSADTLRAYRSRVGG
jgi:hypothetical protein